MAQDVDPKVVQWVNQEVAALSRQGWSLGSPRETSLLKYWRLHRPKMFMALSRAGLATKLATVLDARRYQAKETYIRAGMPLTDAEEMAERDWLIREPESTSQTQHPLAPISTLMTQNG